MKGTFLNQPKPTAVFFLLCLPLHTNQAPVCAQPHFDPSWPENPKIFRVPTHDDRANAVQQTIPDGGYIVAGSTRVLDSEDVNLLVLKLDPLGNLDPAWDPNPKIYGGPKQDAAQAVQQTIPDGGYIVAGYTNGFREGRGDGYLIKLDPQGNLDPAWDPNPKILADPPLYAGVHSVQQTTDRGYIVVGSTRDAGDDPKDVFLLKLDPQGNHPDWKPNPKIYGSPDYWELANSVQQTTDGGYIVAGGGPSPDGAEVKVGFFLLKVDGQGNLDPAWALNPKSIRPCLSDSEIANAIKQTTPDGGYIVVGNNYVNSKNQRICVSKLNSQGNSITGPFLSHDRQARIDDARAVIQTTPDEGYLVAGFTITGVSEICLIKLTVQGDLDPLWPENPKAIGEPDAFFSAQSVQQTTDGGYIVAGGANRGGDPDVLLIKLCSEHPPTSQFIRGDSATDCGIVNITDAVYTLNYLFLGGPRPLCLDAADVDDNQTVSKRPAPGVLRRVVG